MTIFLYCLTLLASLAAGGTLFLTFASSGSAPQQAAGAAMAVAIAIIPYVFSRCVQICVSENNRRNENQRLLDRLDSLERAISGKA
ncbi:hypothetical protein C7T35_15535 [Variovorax sp. WS11]|uniref:hypothetical protein n=1 Tax=Variovorax sp. WS11 TaxID=1105204 RepID=UPI000D0D6C71|nr:hypothetical protein [Variovorax sp. WS11]NDZ12024.1 hypothetical protein [Variovorax sp. WS11]PSL83790.1 hypothetical protein C7T35_15535 [Variovorax sp. WS11]